MLQSFCSMERLAFSYVSIILSLNQETSNKGIIFGMVSICWFTGIRNQHIHSLQSLGLAGSGRGTLGGKTVQR